MNIKILLKQKYDFDVPDWWECQWRRMPCMQISCRFCYRMLKDEQKHKLKGQDPDSLESALESVGDHFAEAMQMIGQMAQEEGIDLEAAPEPERPDAQELMRDERYQKTWAWSKNVSKMLGVAAMNQEHWLRTQAAEDLAWYVSLLPAKVFRQLGSLWGIERGQEERDVDYQYTHYVIGEIIQIMKHALVELEEEDPILEMHFNGLRLELENLEKVLAKLWWNFFRK